MKCPVCSTVNLVMSERKGIEIDYCPECRGVWLDRGELDKIIAASVPQEPPRQPQYYSGHQGQAIPQPQASGHHYPQGHGHKPYRKKSFLEELFD